ncbi:hypothetical protein GUITHDRAFT_135159 [Guillardia theta CCMP2712]|uniref:EF-hand domain-containing protein n=2 Tax=Guillardia theta TaxID=55529 RepID=L1JQM9_GUITC|nr:hypothetical protein GUITHDRAFT_135159 [Guillardia theta CCMP2712]EKX50495.1 hypothetical protein GUITHDRAFT_135159 [Guillardia theta CCMP2712]|eukprot:XP_005837475.1 hypothetical protein GUITHDRAFT_135159 [Guillardia theta CCMP2712]
MGKARLGMKQVMFCLLVGTLPLSVDAFVSKTGLLGRSQSTRHLTCNRGHRKAQKLFLLAEDSRGERQERARKLADDAWKALVVAREAEAKASTLRAGRSTLTDVSSEIRMKKLFGSFADTLYKSWGAVLTGRPGEVDPLGMNSRISETSQDDKDFRIRSVFDRLDQDINGGVDKQELLQGLKTIMNFEADNTIDDLFDEADANGDGLIQYEEFSRVVNTYMAKMESVELAERASQAQQLSQRFSRSYDTVYAELNEINLIGDANATVPALDRLKQEGKLLWWNSAPRISQDTTPQRMLSVTGMSDPDKQMGISVDSFSKFRYQGVGVLGITGALSLILAGFPGPWLYLIPPDLLAGYGYITLIINIFVTVFGRQLDGLNEKRILDQTSNSGDRWVRREAGRFIGAYLCGLPLESILPDRNGYSIVKVFSKRSGNFDLEKLRASVMGDGFIPEGLTKQEMDRQSIVQMFGPVAEYIKYGEATFGYRYFRQLDLELDLAQSILDRRARQIQARYGITMSFQIIKQHEEGFEKVVDAFKRGCQPAEIIAIFETASLSQRVE